MRMPDSVLCMTPVGGMWGTMSRNCPSNANLNNFSRHTSTLTLHQLQHERRTSSSCSTGRSPTGRGTLQECLEEGSEGEGEGIYWWRVRVTGPPSDDLYRQRRRPQQRPANSPTAQRRRLPTPRISPRTHTASSLLPARRSTSPRASRASTSMMLPTTLTRRSPSAAGLRTLVASPRS